MQQQTKSNQRHRNHSPVGEQLLLDFSTAGWGAASAEGDDRVEAQAAAATKTALPQVPESPPQPDREPQAHELLMEAIVEPGNMLRALRRVLKNKGGPGVDGMTVDQLADHLRQAWPRMKQDLLEGQYRPQPVRPKEIPKADGSMRLLGIPTVSDRLVQQATLQVLNPLFDPGFSPHSYGFRPCHSAHQALEAARQDVAQGFCWVVDLDVEKFFDRVNHDLLMARLAKRISDPRLLKLVRAYLQAGVLLGGVVVAGEEGTPQGGPLSPLLANILLDDLDKELERRGHRFCRYADDCNIYVRSQRAGERVQESVTRWLERKLRLKINPLKSAVARSGQRKFLGQRIQLAGHKATLGIHPQSVRRAKARIRQITARKRGIKAELMLKELSRFTDGWVAYHRYTASRTVLRELDRWLRRRIRCFIWKQWKTRRRRASQLMKLGVGRWLAYGSAFNGMGPWRAAGSAALHRALTNARLTEQGFHSLTDRYLRLRASGIAGCGSACPVV
jgi:RNA-directed DNA polymerase